MISQTKKFRVHIVGTHGVPARYGGFETLADFLCQYLGENYEITVYCNSNKYPVKVKRYYGAKLKYINLDASGFSGILYDILTYVEALFTADVILYLSPVGSGFMTPLKCFFRKSVIINHGGLNEWEREKLNWIQRRWAKFNHRIAARFADTNIADNKAYQKSLKENFNADSEVIKYGGDHVTWIPREDGILSNKYPFVMVRYAVSVSRAQIDNNLHLVLEAFEDFKDFKIVLISNWNVSNYGKDLKEKYSNHTNMILLDAIYDQKELDYIRGNAYIYIHSHSRCGTAPSLVEVMNLKQAILCFDVPTNRETTKGKALYFNSISTLKDILTNITETKLEELRSDLYSIAAKEYKWKEISNKYCTILDKYIKQK